MSKSSDTILIEKPNIQTIKFKVLGKSPLICNAFSKRALKAILDKQQKKAVKGHEAKDPERDYQESLYTLESGGYGFPAIAFKLAAVRAAKTVDVAMTDARQMFRVIPDESNLVKINGEPSMREDVVRLNGKTADIRYRGEFKKWDIDLTVEYNANYTSAEQVVNLLELAGFSVGVGDWRTEKSGGFGSFTLVEGAQ